MKEDYPGVTTIEGLQKRIERWYQEIGKSEPLYNVRYYTLSDYMVARVKGPFSSHYLSLLHGREVTVQVYYLGLWGGATLIDDYRIETTRLKRDRVRVTTQPLDDGVSHTVEITWPFLDGSHRGEKETVQLWLLLTKLIAEELTRLPWGLPLNEKPSYKDRVFWVSQSHRVRRKPRWYSAAVDTNAELGSVQVDVENKTISFALTEFENAQHVRDRLHAIAERFGFALPGEARLPLPAGPPTDAPNAPIPSQAPPE